MQLFVVAATLLLLTIVGYYMGRNRALAAVGGRAPQLHSLPSYHGMHVALWCAIPAFLLLLLWLIAGSRLIDALVVAGLPPTVENLPPNELGLLLNDIRNLAA